MAKILLQHNRKTVKEYETAYQMADDIQNVMKTDENHLKKVQLALRQNAFFLCVKGAKITFGNGWRAILPEA